MVGLTGKAVGLMSSAEDPNILLHLCLGSFSFLAGGAGSGPPKILEQPPPGGANTREVGREMSPRLLAIPPIPDIFLLF